MSKEREVKEDKNQVNDLVYDENLEGYFVVKANVVKLTSIAGQKKTDITTPVLFNGENVKCDGNYSIVDGTKYLYVQSKDKVGFVPETALTKL